MIESRRPSGNMLSLVCLVIGLIIAVVLLGLTFNNLMFSRTHAQNDVDATAMVMAAQINEGNRVGQINELVDASRQLVYDSRVSLEACDAQGAGDFSGLYNQLADDARAGQILVELERRNQIKIVTQQMQDLVVKANNAALGPMPVGLPWLRTSSPQIVSVVLGRVEAVSSNVVAINGLPDLAQSDLRNHFVTTRGRLFMGNINAKLPLMDRDLDFKLASLPACVDGAVAPCRNFSEQVFITDAIVFDQGKPFRGVCDQIPTAVLLLSTIDADADVNAAVQKHTSLKISSAATTNGASLDD